MRRARYSAPNLDCWLGNAGGIPAMAPTTSGWARQWIFSREWAVSLVLRAASALRTTPA